MNDRTAARKAFLLASSPDRLRRLARSVAEAGDGLVDGRAAGDAAERIDESVWMIEWAVPYEEPDVQAELVELQAVLVRWRNDLRDLRSDPPTCWLARELSCAWSERLLWVAALLEATE
jgi:hypothetical protein